MDPDTSWCPSCDRQILPKRFLVPVPPPPPLPVRRSKGHPQRSEGLVQGRGRLKPNGSLKQSDTKFESPVKLRTIIDQGPTPLYCSDKCQLTDFHLHGGFPIDYDPDRFSPDVSNSRSEPDSESTNPSVDSQSSNMSPSLATLAVIYNFPPLPPLPPIDEPTSSSNSDTHPPEYTGGVMMAARRIAEYCPKPQKRDSYGHIIPPEPPKTIPGWNDGTHGWRSSIYNFSFPSTPSNNDVKLCGSVAAASHRSCGVQSTFNLSSTQWPSDRHPAACLPVKSTDMIHKFCQSFNHRSESCISLYSSSPPSPSLLHSASPAYQKRERSLVQPGAEGKLLVPDVKVKVHKSSSPSFSSAWSGPYSRRSSVLSPLSEMSSSGDKGGLAQRCESASLPHTSKPIMEGELPCAMSKSLLTIACSSIVVL